MYLSASQIKIVYPVYTADDKSNCTKKWYNKYIKKLPVKEEVATNLGSAFHGCTETYLEYPDNVDGSPYQEGWEKGLTPDQQKIVKTLVDMGIEEQKIVKHPQRVIEMPMWDGKDHVETLRKLKPTWEEDFLKKSAQSAWEIVPGVLLTGFIDYYHSGNTITDWKTSSDPERYGLLMDKKSTRYIARDVQLNIYACYLRKVKGVTGPITVGHTYFKTKPPHKVQEKYLTLTEDHIDKFYNWLTLEVIPNFQKISKMSEGEINTLKPGEKACEKYRGCPYQKLCSGSLTEAEYIRATKIRKEISKMGLMDKIRQKEAETKEQPEPTVVESKVEEVVKKGLGVTGGMGPDPRVELTEKIKALGGKPPRKDAKVETFEKKLAELQEGEEKGEVEVEERGEEGEIAPDPQPEKPTQSIPLSFCLIIGASVRSSNNNIITLTQLFNHVTTGMLKEMDATDWWSLDPFKRRELFHPAKEEILKMVHGKTIVVRFLEPDTQALLNVIYDQATTVIEGGMR